MAAGTGIDLVLGPGPMRPSPFDVEAAIHVVESVLKRRVRLVGSRRLPAYKAPRA